MKVTAWLISALVPLTAVSVLAQNPVSPPPPAPAVPPPAVTAPAEPAPPAKPAKKKAKTKHAKPAMPNSTIILNPPVAATVKCDVLDVRGQGSFAGEVIGRLKKGDSVTVLEEITLGHPHSGEPAEWSKIIMPSSIPVWVSAEFVSSADKTVHAKKVNLRGGPGENYSVVGGLEKGAAVKEIGKKEGWLKIEAPTNAYAFVASEYLETTEAPAPTEATAPPPSAPPPSAPPAPAPTVVNVPSEPAAPTIAAPAPTASSQAEQAALHKATPPEPLTTSAPPSPAAAPEAAASEGPRVVTREGSVHKCFNIQGPADFELREIKTGDLTEYLQPPKDLKFKKFLGKRVRIVGAESLDPRWPRTPILQIQSVELMP